ncbi:hypothetical protein OHR68_07095 [Spirillospora sp. NBC_00431]
MIEQLTQASRICNLAALIASDCGDTLANTLCWRQYEVFYQARPLPAAALPLALQPLLNIPRQLIRDGHANAAYTALEDLLHAARAHGEARIDGRTVRLHTLTTTPDGHQTTITQIWTALLADGTRALIHTGRWQAAAERAAAHCGVGTRLLDGRQVTILAHAHHGRHHDALALLDDSSLTEPWEPAIQQLLRVQCHQLTGRDADRHIPAMITAIHELLDLGDQATRVFRTRAAITALELSRARPDPERTRLTNRLIALARSDGYAAHDLLTHPRLSHELSNTQTRSLAHLVHTCGLSIGALPKPLRTQVLTAARHAEHQLRLLLALRSPTYTRNR